MIAKENITGKLERFAEQVHDLLYLLETRRNAEGVSTLGAKEMAKVLNIPVPAAKARVDKLIDLGIVEKMGSASYKIVQPDLERTPYGTVTRLARILVDMPNATYKEQAEAMGISQKELEVVYGLLVYLIRT